MDPKDFKSLGNELLEAADDLEEKITLALKDILETSVEVAEAWQKVISILAKSKNSAHIVVERSKISFALYPLGEGEPRFMIKAKSAFTEKDRKEFKDLGIRMD